MLEGICSGAEAREAERAVLAEIGDVVIDRQREKLFELYGDALGKAQEAIEALQNAIDRLVEVDATMVTYLVREAVRK